MEADLILTSSHKVGLQSGINAGEVILGLPLDVLWSLCYYYWVLVPDNAAKSAVERRGTR